MNNARIIKRGEIVLLTSGEYSDYDVKALARATADIDVDYIKREYLSQFPDERDYKFRAYHFIEWLIERKMIDKLKYHEFYLGDDNADFDLTVGDIE
jgi:hypothetical protein